MYKIITRGIATNGIVNWSFYKELGQEFTTDDVDKAVAKYQQLLNNYSKNNLKLVEDIDIDILVNADVDPCDCGGDVDLEDILENAVAGSTIVLSANASTNKILTLNKDITINGNGHTIKYDGKTLDSDAEFIINLNSNVTLNDVIIDGNNKARAIASKGGSLTLEKVTIKNNAPSTTRGAGIYATNDTTLIINDCNIVDNVVVNDEEYPQMQYSGDLWIGANVNATINGGTYGSIFVNANEYSNNNKGKLTIINGNAENVWLEYYAGYGADLTLENGIINKLYIASKDNEGEAMMIINKPIAGNYEGGIGSID